MAARMFHSRDFGIIATRTVTYREWTGLAELTLNELEGQLPQVWQVIRCTRR
jgi:hypothetical protein